MITKYSEISVSNDQNSVVFFFVVVNIWQALNVEVKQKRVQFPWQPLDVSKKCNETGAASTFRFIYYLFIYLPFYSHLVVPGGADRQDEVDDCLLEGRTNPLRVRMKRTLTSGCSPFPAHSHRTSRLTSGVARLKVPEVHRQSVHVLCVAARRSCRR